MINIEDKELKPCPFCGYDKLKLDQKMRGSNITYSVRCNRCHARGGSRGASIYSYEEQNKAQNEAIRKWNKRM